MVFSYSQAATAAFLVGIAPALYAQAAGSVRLDAAPALRAVSAGTPANPVVYTSAFADLPRGLDVKSIDWKAANAAVGQFPRGHADLLKWEQNQPQDPTPAKVAK